MDKNPCKEIDIPESLPEWASGFAPTNSRAYPLLTQLPTKNGMNTGNANIYGVSLSPYKESLLYHTVTDAGNLARYSISELEERFYPPKYVSKKLTQQQSLAIKLG